MSITVELYEAFDYSDVINVYDEGSVVSYGKGEDRFEEILSGFKTLIDGAHDMPAFGVSINSLTTKEMQKGLWVEFGFDQQYKSNGMPYEKLLVNVQKSFAGFNIVRYNSDSGYDGRCFYYDLVNKDMSDFYDILR